MAIEKSERKKALRCLFFSAHTRRAENLLPFLVFKGIECYVFACVGVGRDGERKTDIGGCCDECLVIKLPRPLQRTTSFPLFSLSR
jgi:hypothetical protein